MYYLLNKKFVLTIGLLVGFTSCTTKSIDLLSKDSLYNQGLEYTKIKTIVKDNDVKGILNITHLNPTYPKKFDNTYNQFLVGIYLDEYSEEYMMYLNKKRFISKELLSVNTKLFKNIPAYNPHSTYYIIKFKKEKSDKLKLNFTHAQYGSADLEFNSFY